MPVIGSKRRNSSEATCDSSHCAFCFQRSRSGLSCIQHGSCPDQTYDSSASQPSNEFETWLNAQIVSTAAHEQISLDKIGLQLPGLLHSPPSKRNRTSIDLDEASSSDSSDPQQLSLPAIYESGLSLDMPCLNETACPPWQWSQAWAEHPDPVPAVFQEIGTFQEPASRQHAAQHTADIVCGVEFSPDGRFIASAGVAKQVRLYSLAGHLQQHESAFTGQPLVVQRLPSKLSSLAWDHNQNGVVTVGDYDGVVSQIHLESGHFIADLDDHNGQRVWSVAHSVAEPGLSMSTSDDGTARIWTGSAPYQAVATIQPQAGVSVCDGSFCNYDRNLLALASANHSAYVYDLRRLDEPLHMLTGHSRAVSYVRFLSGQRLVTASVDGSLACWDLPYRSESAGDQVVPDWDGNFSGNAHLRSGKEGGKAWRRFVGHKNAKNFVGLTVRPEDGLMASGSETSTVYAYNTHWASPIAKRDLAATASQSCMQCLPEESEVHSPLVHFNRQKQFVSAVDFMPASCQAQQDFQGGPLLAAAMSTGTVKVLALNLMQDQEPSLSESSEVREQ